MEGGRIYQEGRYCTSDGWTCLPGVLHKQNLSQKQYERGYGMRKNKGLAIVLAISMAWNLCLAGGVGVNAAGNISGEKQEISVESQSQAEQENSENKMEQQRKKEAKKRQETKEKERKEIIKLMKKGIAGNHQKKAGDEVKVVASMSALVLDDGGFAEAPKGSEISIESAKDLQALSEYTNAGQNTEGVTFTQTKDIDCKGATMAAIGSNWVTGETDEEDFENYIINSFRGIYDGGGHKLFNVTIRSQESQPEYYSEYLGLFGYLNKATVKNVVVDSIEFCTFSEEQTMSGISMSVIAGYMIESTVQNCENYANITLDTSFGHLAGIVGCTDKDSKIKNCTNYGNLTAIQKKTEDGEETENDNDGIFGIVEHMDGEVSDCVNEGSLTNYDYVCGIAGYGDYSVSKVLRCKNKGNLTTGYFVAGIVMEHYGEVADCENSGDLESDYRAAGIGRDVERLIRCTNTGEVKAVEIAAGIINSSYSYSEVIGCTNRGNVTGKLAGGIGIYGYSPSIIDCVNEGKICADYLAGGILAVGFKATISGCINEGEIESKDSAGGILGGMDDDDVIGKCFIGNSKNMAKVSAQRNAGGIAGNVLGAQIVNVWNYGEVEGKQSAGGILGLVDLKSHFDEYYSEYYYEGELDETEYEMLKQSYISGDKQKDVVNTIGNAVNIGTVVSEKVSGAIIGASDITNTVKYCYYQEASCAKVCGSDDTATAVILQVDGWKNETFVQEMNQNISSLEMPMALMMEYNSKDGVTWKNGFVLEVKTEEYDYEDRIIGDAFHMLGLNYALYDKVNQEYFSLTPIGKAFVLPEPKVGEYEIHRIMSDGTYVNIEEDVMIEEGCSLSRVKVYPSLLQIYSEITYSKAEDGSYWMEMNQPFFALAYEDKEEYSDVIIPEVAPAREGYTFGGWYSSPYAYSEELYEYYKTTRVERFIRDYEIYEVMYEWIGDDLDKTKEEYVSSQMTLEYGYGNLEDFKANYDTYFDKAYQVKEFVTTYYDEDEEEEYSYLTSEFVYAKWIKNPEPTATAPVPTPAQTGTPSAILDQQTDVNQYKETTGSYVKKSGVIYKVDTAKKTAKVTGVTSTQVKKLTIQATVTSAGVKYKVTSVGKKAFANCKKLRKITVKGKNLKSVHKTALKGTKKKVSIKANKKIKKLFKKAQKNR